MLRGETCWLIGTDGCIVSLHPIITPGVVRRGFFVLRKVGNDNACKLTHTYYIIGSRYRSVVGLRFPKNFTPIIRQLPIPYL